MQCPIEVISAIAPSPDPSPPVTVVVQDSVRDLFDWINFGVGVASAVIGVIAILIAIFANRIARTAERRAVQRADLERRRVFELGLLSELLEELYKSVPHLMHTPAASNPLSARLKMMPVNELGAWRVLVDGDRSRIVARFDPEAPNGRNNGYLVHGDPPKQSLRDAITAALIADVTSAVEARMSAADQHGGGRSGPQL